MGDLVIGLARSVVQGALTRAQTAIEEDAKLRQKAQRDLVFISLEFEMMQAFISVAKQDELRDNVARTWVRYVRELAFDFEDCIELVVHLDNSPNWWWRLLPSFMAPPRPLDLAVVELELLRSRAEDVSNSYSRYSRINDSATKLVMLQQPVPGTGIGATTFDMLIKARDASKMGDLTEFITLKDNDLELQVISVCGTAGDLRSTYHHKSLQ